jgi:hypothetical protein
VLASSKIGTVPSGFLRWWMRWCEVMEFEVVEFEVVEFEVVEFEVVEFEVVEFEVVGVHHLIYN